MSTLYRGQSCALNLVGRRYSLVNPTSIFEPLKQRRNVLLSLKNGSVAARGGYWSIG